ncbi:multicopper oxidase family protein [Salegentibacter chungangensis]|uniref:Multicopper oxidase domain-containing protein n=1 Tax=Salegentibacter chungangensis TaxID=1335724 RepID=A0ABW3NUW9_9FLAO
MIRKLFSFSLFLILISPSMTSLFAQEYETYEEHNLLDPLSQTKFVNELPIPEVLQPTSGETYYEVPITQFEQHLGLFDESGKALMTTVWGYNGSYPGPTIEAYKDVPITVRWENNLTDKDGFPLIHLFSIDPTLHRADPDKGIPVVTHLHGGHTEVASDGHPQAWYTPYFEEKGEHFVKENYEYANDQEATTLWYHDHALGVTRLNVYAGLAGFYLLRDAWESSLNLPSGEYEVPLVIQDRLFLENGDLFYPSGIDELEDPLEKPLPSDVTVLPEMFGNIILVNGKAWPYLEVEPRKYRLRLLNGSDSRFYELFLPGINFYQIGSDGGLLNSPVRQNRLTIGPGERLDVIVDFSDPQVSGQTLIMKNTARSPYPFGDTPKANTTGQIMAFKVTKALAGPDTSVIPLNLRPSPINDLGESTETRKLVLFEGTDEYGRLKPMLGTAQDGPLEYMDEITENPMLNAVEEWEIYNTTADAHPIHLHLVHFQVINTQKFNVKQYVPKDENSIQLLGQPKPPSPENAGWKDTFIVYPGEVARVKAKFDKEGFYVWHCHILSHEDYEMMRPFYVGEMPLELVNKDLSSETDLSLTTKEESFSELYSSLKIAPNPMGDYTRIQFSVEDNTEAVLRIYDFMGRVVATPFTGKVRAGEIYQVLFKRESLAGNIYICKIETANGNSVEKMIIAD